jgi:hypothetical protein
MSDLQPVHVVIDQLVQVTIGRRNAKDGALDPITPSINDIGAPGDAGMNMAYKRAKELWEKVFVAVLTEPPGEPAQFVKPGTASVQILIPEVKRTGELPRPCGKLMVEGLMVWPDRRERDRGNYQTIVDKWLGDALQLGGWLPKDDWTRYGFGNLERALGQRKRIELTLFPALERDELRDIDADASLSPAGLF